MFRPTITDMQDKYCGNCYDIYLIQSQYKGNHKLALTKINIVAITKILFVHVWISCSPSVVLHDPSPYNHCALTRKESLGGLLTQAVVWGGLRHPREARKFGGPQVVPT